MYNISLQQFVCFFISKYYYPCNYLLLLLLLLDALQATLTPLAVYTTDLAYQSVRLHWISSVYSNSSHTPNSNLSYIFHIAASGAILDTYSVPVLTRGANYTRNSEEYSLRVTGLKPNTQYTYKISALTWYGELELNILDIFATFDPST